MDADSPGVPVGSVDYEMSIVREELIAAMSKFGPFASPHEGYAVILEELDELWAEVKANRGRTHHAFAEARQVAAMAVRYLVDFPFPGPILAALAPDKEDSR